MLSPIIKNIVNDVDLDRLQELVTKSETRPDLGFEVTTRWTGQFRSESRPGPIRMGDGELLERHHVILADEPEQILGSNEAPNPQELLMAARNSCMTVGYVAGAAKRGINLSRIESRPMRQGLGRYMFFCDLEGKEDDRLVAEAIAQLRTKAESVRILGSYPVG